MSEIQEEHLSGVFLSYRREDTAGWTGRIYDRVSARVGADRVFLDVEAVAPGEDFTEAITSVLRTADAVAVVIGPAWLTAAAGQGERRLDDPDDHVRREILMALESEARVVPVLVDGARMPNARDLPEDIRSLAYRTAVVVSDIRFEHDMLRLLDALGFADNVSPGAKQQDNLPAEATNFVGRAEQLSNVRSLCEQHRLVTITGVGGSGKTRLALHVARGLVDSFDDGVWLVELGHLGEAALLASEVAAQLGIRNEPGSSPLEDLVGYLSERRLLLVLDNCEHLVDSAAELVQRVLNHCAGVVVLATSREALRVPGEATFHAPPLQVPQSRETADLQTLGEIESVQMFMDRAQQRRSGFELTSDNAAAVAWLCSRLDGLPLALELAAAQLRLLTLDQINERLEDRFRLLTGGARTALPRHRTLQAAMHWSYDLLERPERELFQRLSVFAGGFSVDGVEAVHAGPSAKVVETLGNLIDASLIEVEDAVAGQARYRMLETVRQFAADKLAETGDQEAPRRAHAAFYREAAKDIAGELPTSWIERLNAERDNFRDALRWSIGTGDTDSALKLTLRLARFWFTAGYLHEAQEWLRRVLEQEGPDSDLRARVLATGAWLSFHGGRMERALALARNAADMATRLGNEEVHSVALGHLAAATSATDTREGVRLYRQALDGARRVGNLRLVEVQLFGLGWVTAWRGRTDEVEAIANELSTEFPDLEGTASHLRGMARLFRGDNANAVIEFEAAADAYRSGGHTHFAAWADVLRARALLNMNDPDAATHIAASALQDGRNSGAGVVVALALQALGRAALLLGDLDAAHKRLEEALRATRRSRLDGISALALDDMAHLAADEGQPADATRWAAHGAQLHQTSGTVRPPQEENAFQTLVADLRQNLGDRAFEQLWAEAKGESPITGPTRSGGD